MFIGIFHLCHLTRRVEMPKIGGEQGLSGLRPSLSKLGVPMSTEFTIVILSIVALHVAALAGGGLALGVMKLLGRKPPLKVHS